MCLVVKFVRTWVVDSFVMESSNPIFRSKWCNHWTRYVFFSRTFLTAERSVARTVLLVGLQARYVSNQRRRATRMRAEPKIVVCSTSLGNVKSGEHGRKDICLDLMVVMACHRFWM